MKNPDKNLSGKRDEREVKLCKFRFFTLHSSFFVLGKLSFRTAKHKLWPRQRSCFTASNITFHTTKHGLSRCETLPLANLYFVNHPITNQYPRNHLSINALQKTAKIAVFLTDCPFRCQHPPFFGVKIRIFIYKSCNEYFATQVLPNQQFRCNGFGDLQCPIVNDARHIK